jgi:dihydrofolate reductase
VSLDGFIAGPNGESDWIVTDPTIDFNSLFKRFDTILVGRRTFEVMARHGRPTMPGMKTYVFSKTPQPSTHRDVIIAGNLEQTVAEIRAQAGKDIWLFGGGSLFRSLLGAGLVDTVELAIVPVLLGGGIPMLAVPAGQESLKLTGHKIYGTGVVSLEYAVTR